MDSDFYACQISSTGDWENKTLSFGFYVLLEDVHGKRAEINQVY
jgi:hypothetical protein